MNDKVNDIDLIPDGVYCDNCPFWHKLEHHRKRKDLCWGGELCTDNCDDCNEEVSFCEYLGYIEYGQYPLGDSCKVCDIKYK